MKVQQVVLWSLLASWLILGLVACGSSSQETPAPDTGQPAPGESPLPQPGTSPVPGPGAGPVPAPGDSPLSPLPTPPGGPLAAATTYLAGQLDISSDEVSVVSFEAVEWPDASLGCPEPGMMYAQVVSPGYRFLLQAGGTEYEVHTDQTGQGVVMCERQ